MTQDPQHSIWDSFWADHASSEDIFHFLLWRIRFLFSHAYASKIFKYMGKNPDANILEVGCGSARTLHYLNDILGGSHCFGFDLSTNAIKLLRSISPTFHAAVGSAFELPIVAGKFDASFSIGLIEHFTREQAAQMVNEKIRVTRPSGVVGIMVPWQNSVYNLIVRKAFGRHWPFGNENPFRRAELATFMETLGLQDVKIHVIYGSTLLGYWAQKTLTLPHPNTNPIDGTEIDVEKQQQKTAGGVLLLLGIVTAVLAQITLLLSTPDMGVYFVASQWWKNSWHNTSPIPGITLYILASVFFILGLRSLNDPVPTLPIHTDKQPQRQPKLGFWATSLVLSGTVAVYASQANKNDPYGYLFSVAWIVSIVLLVISVLIYIGWQPPSTSAMLTWLKAHRAELIVIAAIIIAAFLIRFVDVELHPYSFINDEGHMGSGGACILNGTCTHFFSLGWADQPRLAFLPYAISTALLGKTALAVRLVSVITGTLSVLAVYLFTREVFDRKIAWISAILLSTLPVHVHFSRTGVDNIIDTLTAPLILWLLFRGVKRGSTLSFLAAGIVAGLCIYTYPGSLLAALLGIVALGYMALRTRDFLQAHSRTNILIFVLAAIVIVIPIMGYYYSNSEYFLFRLKQESILLKSTGIQNESQTSGISVAEILASQFAKSSLVFIATGAPINFFNSPKPYLPAAEAIVFMLGMAYVLWRIKDSRYMVIFVWFWAAVILGSTLTGGAPTSQRMLMSMPALVIIIAVGIIKILGAFKQLYQPAARFAPILLLGFILCIGYTNIGYYFYEYRIGHYYEDPANELTYETSAYIAPLHTQGRMYLICDPEDPYLSFASFNYFSPDVEKNKLSNITQKTLARLPRDKDMLFIALPNYKPSLELISQWMPGGEWIEFKRRYQPQYMLFYSYKITKEQLAAITP